MEVTIILQTKIYELNEDEKIPIELVMEKWIAINTNILTFNIYLLNIR